MYICSEITMCKFVHKKYILFTGRKARNYFLHNLCYNGVSSLYPPITTLFLGRGRGRRPGGVFWKELKGGCEELKGGCEELKGGCEELKGEWEELKVEWCCGWLGIESPPEVTSSSSSTSPRRYFWIFFYSLQLYTS